MLFAGCQVPVERERHEQMDHLLQSGGAMLCRCSAGGIGDEVLVAVLAVLDVKLWFLANEVLVDVVAVWAIWL